MHSIESTIQTYSYSWLLISALYTNTIKCSKTPKSPGVRIEGGFVIGGFDRGCLVQGFLSYFRPILKWGHTFVSWILLITRVLVTQFEIVFLTSFKSCTIVPRSIFRFHALFFRIGYIKATSRQVALRLFCVLCHLVDGGVDGGCYTTWLTVHCVVRTHCLTLQVDSRSRPATAAICPVAGSEAWTVGLLYR